MMIKQAQYLEEGKQRDVRHDLATQSQLLCLRAQTLVQCYITWTSTTVVSLLHAVAHGTQVHPLAYF